LIGKYEMHVLNTLLAPLHMLTSLLDVRSMLKIHIFWSMYQNTYFCVNGEIAS
jgi:hypothetical protein